MLSISKTKQNYKPFITLVIITNILWLLSKWFHNDWFDNVYKYPAKIASLSATVLFVSCFVLSARIYFIERYFNGLDKVYQLHKRLGKAAAMIIIFHPVFLALDKLADPTLFFGNLWFIPVNGDLYALGHNIGLVALLLMALLIIPTIWVKVPYHRWKMSHEYFGAFLVVVIAHIIVVNRDVSAYPLLRIWVYGLLLLALMCYTYIRFLYRVIGPRHNYVVDEIERVGDVLEIVFSPVREKMSFRPSQFVYLVVHKKGITEEAHPYSIACGYNLESRFKLGIKKAGDHTRSLDLLEAGDKVSIYGPYGHFSDHFIEGRRDCVFIGGGIGITPFLGMWHVALHSGERVVPAGVALPEVKLHPEIQSDWKSPAVSLFYLVPNKDQASFDNDIRNEVILSHFHGFPACEERGHYYELYENESRGLITAEYINNHVRGGVIDKYIFLCGPSPMVQSLIKQFTAIGVNADQIIIEDFNLI